MKKDMEVLLPLMEHGAVGRQNYRKKTRTTQLKTVMAGACERIAPVPGGSATCGGPKPVWHFWVFWGPVF